MSDLLADMAADSQSSMSLPGDRSLDALSSIADSIVSADQTVKNLEKQLKEAKQKLLKLTDEDLPSKMQEIGMTNFTLQDGSKVEIKEIYGARISKDNEAAAFDWLRSRGEGDIIKNTVTVRFGKEKDNEAQALVEELRSKAWEPEQKQEVHASTLKAWVKERVEQGKELDMDLFSVWVGQRATITKAK